MIKKFLMILLTVIVITVIFMAVREKMNGLRNENADFDERIEADTLPYVVRELQQPEDVTDLSAEDEIISRMGIDTVRSSGE